MLMLLWVKRCSKDLFLKLNYVEMSPSLSVNYYAHFTLSAMSQIINLKQDDTFKQSIGVLNKV